MLRFTQNPTIQRLVSTLQLTIGVVLAGLGIKGFLIPNHFIDGGVTGSSMLIAHISPIPLPIAIVCLNIPFIVIGFFRIRKLFAFKSGVTIIGLALCLVFIDYPIVTQNTLLAAVFGGFFLGAGIGFSIRGGGVLDGTEVMALLLSRRTGFTVGDIILMVNICIFSLGALFLGIEPAMFSILTYLSASKTVDFLVYGLEEFVGVMIISEKAEEIKEILINRLGLGVTIYRGARGRSNVDQDILFCVASRFDSPRLKQTIHGIDATAFVIMHTIIDSTGGVIRRKNFH